MSYSFQLLVCSRNPLVGEFFQHVLKEYEGSLTYVGQTYTLGKLNQNFSGNNIDIVVFDIEYDNQQQLSDVEHIHRANPNAIIVFYSFESTLSAMPLNTISTFSCLTKPASLSSVHTLLDQMIERLRLSNYLSFHDFQNETIEEAAMSIQTYPSAKLTGIENSICRQIIKNSDGKMNVALHQARQYIYYLSSIFKTSYIGQNNDIPLEIISNQSIERLKDIGQISDIREIISQYLRDCNALLGNQPKDAYVDRIEVAKYLIQQQIRNGIAFTLESIAKELYISSCYLSRTFKKYSGVNFSEYVQSSRIDYAKVLLATTADNIESVANKCGYSEVNSFRRMFKARVGISPTEYRNSLLLSAN